MPWTMRRTSRQCPARLLCPKVAVVVIPDPEAAQRVAIQVLTADPARIPHEEWTELAAALCLDPRSGPGRSA